MSSFATEWPTCLCCADRHPLTISDLLSFMNTTRKALSNLKAEFQKQKSFDSQSPFKKY